jgi:hypothetical protein
MRDWRDGLSDEIRQLEDANGNGRSVTNAARQVVAVLRGYEVRARKLALRGWESERHAAALAEIGSRGHGIPGRRRQGR